MAFPGILRRLFEKDGAGPLLRGDILPLERAAYSVMLTASGTWTAPAAQSPPETNHRGTAQNPPETHRRGGFNRHTA